MGDAAQAASWVARNWWMVVGALAAPGVLVFLALRRRLRLSKQRPILRTAEELDREQERLEAHREEQRRENESGRAADHADVDDHWMRGSDG